MKRSPLLAFIFLWIASITCTIIIFAVSFQKPTAPTGSSQEQIDAPIVAGYGWGAVHLGATKEEVEAIIGSGDFFAQYSDIYFVDYPSMGLQISFQTSDDKINAIFFYNHQQGSERFATFQGETSTGISWNSSLKEVLSAYGSPILNYQGVNEGIPWVRVGFDGIDFRFENNKMVRISVPGR